MSSSPPPRPSLDPRFARKLRWLCAGFALPSFALAASMLFAPDAFFGALGVGGAPFAQALYGGAIAGEGVMFARCAQAPARYLVFFEYVLVYKALACLGGSAVLLQMDAPPLMAWGVIGGWATAGVLSAWVVRGSR